MENLIRRRDKQNNAAYSGVKHHLHLVSSTDWLPADRALAILSRSAWRWCVSEGLISCSQSRLVLESNLTLWEAKPDEDLGDFHFRTVFKSTIKISLVTNPLNVIHFLSFFFCWYSEGSAAGRVRLSASFRFISSQSWAALERIIAWISLSGIIRE